MLELISGSEIEDRGKQAEDKQPPAGVGRWWWGRLALGVAGRSRIGWAGEMAMLDVRNLQGAQMSRRDWEAAHGLATHMPGALSVPAMRPELE